MVASDQVSLSGQALALAEDTLYFQGEKAPVPAVGIGVAVISDEDKKKLDNGLLGVAESNYKIDVPLTKGGTYGLETYNAVAKRGIPWFTKDTQGPPYALILSPDIFGDANLPLQANALQTPASSIQAVLAQGPFLMSAGLPEKTGFLAALGGRSVKLYVGTGPLIEFNNFDNSTYAFTARESIQYFCSDTRSLIRLKFE
jgi:hypothetical protein